MWKKIFYIAIAIILGIFVAYISYNSNQYTHLQNIVNKELKEENYQEIPKIFGGAHDSKPILEVKNDNVNVLIFNGTAVTDLKYKDSRYFKYETCYYIYLFDVNYTYLTSSNNLNKTSIEFITKNGNSYNLPFILTSSINKDDYIAEPENLEEALLHSSRNIPADIDSWNFMTVKLTSKMAEIITENRNDIVGFKLIDHEGIVVGEYNVKLDFSQNFHKDSDVLELIDRYNEYLDIYLKGEDVAAASKEFDSFYSNWEEEFRNNKENTGYELPYGKDFLQPSSIVWKTVGFMAIYSLIMVGFYFIFFHLDFLQSLLSKNKYKNPKKKETIYIPKKNNNAE